MRSLLFMLVLLSTARSQKAGISIAGDIDSAHAMLLDVALTFHDGASTADTSSQQLREVLRRITTATDTLLPHSIRGRPTWQQDQQNLTFALFQFDLLRSQSTNYDTLRDGFRGLFYAFHRLCQPYLYERAVMKAERSVFLFAASITCECTRRMCDEYLAALALLRKEHVTIFDLVIIDSVLSPELMDKYKVNIIPTAIGIDRRGNETGRLEGNDYTDKGIKELIKTRFGGRQ